MLNKEQEILNQITMAEEAYRDAKRDMAELHKKYLAAETLVINASLLKEKLQEDLRAFKAHEVIKGESYSLFDEDDGSS